MSNDRLPQALVVLWAVTLFVVIAYALLGRHHGLDTSVCARSCGEAGMLFATEARCECRPLVTDDCVDPE